MSIDDNRYKPPPYQALGRLYSRMLDTLRINHTRAARLHGQPVARIHAWRSGREKVPASAILNLYQFLNYETITPEAMTVQEAVEMTGLTQKQIADKLRVTPMSVTNWKNLGWIPSRHVPDIRQMIKGGNLTKGMKIKRSLKKPLNSPLNKHLDEGVGGPPLSDDID